MENNEVPVYDLSEMDKIDNNRVEKKDIYIKEEFSKPVTHEGLLEEKKDVYNLDESTLHEIVNKLKIMKYDDMGIIDNYLNKIKSNKSAVNSVIEFRSKNTLINLFSEDQIDEDRLLVDIAILKTLQADKFDFSDTHIHLNYNSNSKEEIVNISELIDLYKEAILSKKGTEYRIYTNDKEIDPIYELNSVKFQNYLRNEINEMIDESNTIDNEEEKIERL